MGKPGRPRKVNKLELEDDEDSEEEIDVDEDEEDEGSDLSKDQYEKYLKMEQERINKEIAKFQEGKRKPHDEVSQEKDDERVKNLEEAVEELQYYVKIMWSEKKK